MRLIAIFIACAALAACTAPVQLRNPATGQTASCGPYMLDSLGSDSQAEREARCISDYQREGYERVPE